MITIRDQESEKLTLLKSIVDNSNNATESAMSSVQNLNSKFGRNQVRN